MKDESRTAVLEKILVKQPEDKSKTPYMSKGIYNNYERGMKERNLKRKGQKLTALPIRTFEEWSKG